jgi:hypothetical protein
MQTTGMVLVAIKMQPGTYVDACPRRPCPVADPLLDWEVPT